MALRLPGALRSTTCRRSGRGAARPVAGIRVAVIDSGIEADHPELDGCVDADERRRISRSTTTASSWSALGPHDDSFGHGTACAGIIHSIAPEARITSVRVLGAGLDGKAAVVPRGLAWAVERGLRRDQPLARHDASATGRCPSTRSATRPTSGTA